MVEHFSKLSLMRLLFRILLLSICCFAISCNKDLYIDPSTPIEISDNTFLNELLRVSTQRVPENIYDPEYVGHIPQNIDANGDGLISIEEAQAVRRIDVRSRGLGSLDGIKEFENLEILLCYNNKLKELDLSELRKLKYLLTGGNQEMTSLNINGVTSLEILNINDCNISNLEMKDLDNLVLFASSLNRLGELDFSNMQKLKEIHAVQDSLTVLKVDNCVSLEILNCKNDNFWLDEKEKNNAIKELVVVGLPNLRELDCSYNESIEVLKVKNLPNLTYLDCSFNKINELNVEDLRSLTTLSCLCNELTELDINNLQYLKNLSCEDNNLREFNVSGLEYLEGLAFGENKDLSVVNLENLGSLEMLSCEYSDLEELSLKDIPNLSAIYVIGNKLKELKIENCEKLRILDCRENQISELNVEKLNLVHFFCSRNLLSSVNFSHMTGLTNLRCEGNYLSSLDVRHNAELVNITCGMQNDNSKETKLKLTMTAEQNEAEIYKSYIYGNENVEVIVSGL